MNDNQFKRLRRGDKIRCTYFEGVYIGHFSKEDILEVFSNEFGLRFAPTHCKEGCGDEQGCGSFFSAENFELIVIDEAPITEEELKTAVSINDFRIEDLV